MSRRFFVCQVVLAAAVLVSANVAVSWLAANSVPRQVLRHAESAEAASDVFLGNSMMAAGLDEYAFALSRPGSRPLNLGLGSSSPVEHLLIYRQQEKHRGARVYYGFAGTQLTDVPEGGWHSLVGNRAMSYYVDPDVAIGLYADHAPFRALGLRAVGWVPALRERYAIWGNVEILRRYLEELGMPTKLASRFGRAEDFASLTVDLDAFGAGCALAAYERRPLSQPVQAIVRSATDRGSRVVFIEMPQPRGQLELYNARPEWADYREHLFELLRDAGVLYVDASDWIAYEGFADPLHLNASGAAMFSSRLAKEHLE